MKIICYETGIEETEILGSGSTYRNTYRTTDEAEAFKAYQKGCNNYLHRYVVDSGMRTKQWWDDDLKQWRS